MRYLIILIYILFITFISQQTLFAEQSNTVLIKPCETKGISSLPNLKLKLIVKGLKYPVHITAAGDYSKRLFITEQAGVIRILKHDRILPVPFLDIRERVKSGGEMGLLSMAFHPKFKKTDVSL